MCCHSIVAHVVLTRQFESGLKQDDDQHYEEQGCIALSTQYLLGIILSQSLNFMALTNKIRIGLVETLFIRISLVRVNLMLPCFLSKNRPLRSRKPPP